MFDMDSLKKHRLWQPHSQNINAVLFIEGIVKTKVNKFGKRCQSKRAFTILKATKSELTRSVILHVPFHASGQQSFATHILLWLPTCHLYFALDSG